MDTSNVRYHCPCASSPADMAQLQSTHSEADEKPDEISLLDPRLTFALHSLHDLYFCADCGCARCPRCVMEEVSVLFCPTCLFEVPSKSGISSMSAPEAFCGRSCLRCPLCFSSLQTLEHAADQASDDNHYYLKCPHCQWSSKTTQLHFDKNTGMTKQMAQQFVNPREAAFLSVKNAFKSTKDAERERDYASLASGQLDRLSLLDPASEEAQAEPVFNTPIVQTDEAAVESIRTLLVSTDLDGIPNTVQRQLQASGGPNLTQELMPLRTPLRTRRAKRCRACRHILCKFETRQPVMQAVKFRIRLAASSYLPTLTLSRTQHEVDSATTGGAEAAQQKSVYLLKIANPLYEQIKVTLSAPRVTELGDEVVVIAPEILIGGYTDVWEMPQSSTSAASSQGLVSSKKGTEAVLGKLHSSGSNWATIEMHLSRRQLETSSAWASVGDVSVPLFVSVEFEAEQELEDPDKAAPVASSKLTRKIGFWTVLTARQSPV